MKGLALVLVILLLGLLAFVGLHTSDVSIIVNGQKLVGPAKLAAEGWGMIVGIVGLFCAAILLAFVVAGVGLVVLGVLVFAGLVATWLAFPFLVPVLVPLFVVWIVVAAARSGRHARR
jgi:hypothetical protein